MDVELALKINKLVHNECKDVPHDIGLRIEELVRLHQSELKNCSIPAVVCSCLSEEFVENFTNDGELTPIDIVSEITGLTYDEIRSCSKIVRVP